jgi:hypothetical protein
MRRLLASLLSLSIALSSLPAFGSEADAKDFFVRGRELRSKGDCAGAVPLFRKAWELYPQGLGSLRNLAECEEQLGHYASSRRSWLDLKRALLVNKDSKYDGWEADADAAATRLAPKVARLTISITQRGADGEGPLSDASIKVLVNGDALDRKLLEVPLDRDPGTYKVRVEGGKEAIEKEVTLTAGDSKSVKLVVDLADKPKDDTPPPDIKKDNPPVDTPPPSNTTKTIGYITLGVGGVALVGAGVSLILRQSALSDLSAACGDYEKPQCSTSKAADARDAIDRGKTFSMLTNVLAGVAVVGIGTGIVLIVTSGKSESKTTLRVTPTVGGAFLSGEF